jgi:hypothetical protein
MHPRCCRPVVWLEAVPPLPDYLPALYRYIIPQAVTHSSAPEDGRNHRPKHVELIGIINKPLLLHLVGCLYYLVKVTLTVVKETLTVVKEKLTSCWLQCELRAY